MAWEDVVAAVVDGEGEMGPVLVLLGLVTIVAVPGTGVDGLLPDVVP